MNWADWAVITEFLVALVGLLAFVGGYVGSTHGEWRKTPEGRHLVAFRLGIAAIMLLGIINNLAPEYPGRDALRVITYGWFMLAVLQGDRLLYVAQRELRQQQQARAVRRAAREARRSEAPSDQSH